MRIVAGSSAIAVTCLAVWLQLMSAQATPEPTSLRFYTYDWNERGNIVGVAGVKCLALRADGVESLGVTEKSGELAISYERLFRPGNLALLFCAPGSEVQCTSLRLDISHLHGFAEYNVRVTRPEIIDRQPVAGHREKR